MKKNPGFSLTEVVVTLFLLTSILLTLLQEQLQLYQLLRGGLVRSLASTLLDNNMERVLAKQPLQAMNKPYHLNRLHTKPGKLEIVWGEYVANHSGCCHLEHALI
jgi:Tfp pilus assembly protein PilV